LACPSSLPHPEGDKARQLSLLQETPYRFDQWIVALRDIFNSGHGTILSQQQQKIPFDLVERLTYFTNFQYDWTDDRNSISFPLKIFPAPGGGD
jgi:hypothetical protein